VIAFARAGLGHAVAPLGTALTESQIRLLWRAGPEPVVCLDGDAAGVRAAALAAERALPLLEPGKTLRFVFLEDGADPDDLLREKGPEALSEAIAGARPLIDVIWEREVAAEPLDDPDRRAGFRKRLRALAAKIEDPDVKTEYRAELEARMETLFARAQPSRARLGGFQRGGPGGGGYGRGKFAPPSRPTGELLKARRTAHADPMARQLLLAAVEYPEIAEAEAEALAETPCGPLDSLRDAILDACFAGESVLDGGLRESLVRRGYGSELARLSVDMAPMRASLGGDEADTDSRSEAWRRLSTSYMERVARDARTTEERARQADVFEKGDSDALNSFLAAVRRDRHRR